MSNLAKIRRSDLPRNIEFSEDGAIFLMSMNPACTTANMQENNAAFEAWALYARTAGYERVVLSESESASEISKDKEQHYHRFLFRAYHFEKGFDWFTVSPGLKEKADAFIKKELSRSDLYVNAPLKAAVPHTESPEAMIERLLVLDGNRELLNRILHLNLPKYYNQLPVGLFGGRVIKDAAIFPRSHAAIDIWGLDGSTFHLIELKVGKNQNLGVLSEVFFYACFIYEMYCQRHLERKDPDDLKKYGKKPRGFIELGKANIDSVIVHILTEKKHPRLDAAFAELQLCKLNGIRFANAECHPLTDMVVTPE